MKRKRKASTPFPAQSEKSSQEPFRLVPPGARCFVCGTTEEAGLSPQTPLYPQVYIHGSCLNTEAARAWFTAREQENPLYKRYRFLISVRAEVLCATCQTRHWLWVKSAGMGAGSWETHCTQCYRLGKAHPGIDPRTGEDIDSQIWQLQQRFYLEGLTAEIDQAMKDLAAIHDRSANPEPCVCGGRLSIAAKPRCKHCGQVLYDTYFNIGLPPRADDLAYQSYTTPATVVPQSQERGSDTEAVPSTPRASIDAPDERGLTPLMRAAAQGHTETVRALIAQGATLDLQSDIGWTALMWATHFDHLEIVQLLLERGADYEVHGSHETAFGLALRAGQAPIVHALLQAGVQIDQPETTDRPILIQAVESRHLAVVQELLRGGAPVNIQNLHGATALSNACLNGQTDIAQELLSYGACVDQQGKRGWTALMWATQYGYQAIVQLLLAHGAQVNISNRGGRTALMMAACEGHIEIVQALLTQGAEVNRHDRDGWTALRWANEWEQTAVVQVLQEAGAH